MLHHHSNMKSIFQINVYDILEKIYEIADKQRHYIMAKQRHEKKRLRDIVKSLGIGKSDFLPLCLRALMAYNC